MRWATGGRIITNGMNLWLFLNYQGFLFFLMNYTYFLQRFCREVSSCWPMGQLSCKYFRDFQHQPASLLLSVRGYWQPSNKFVQGLRGYWQPLMNSSEGIACQLLQTVDVCRRVSKTFDKFTEGIEYPVEHLAESIRYPLETFARGPSHFKRQRISLFRMLWRYWKLKYISRRQTII